MPSTGPANGSSSCSSVRPAARLYQLVDDPDVVLDHLHHEVHAVHPVPRGQPQASGWVEVHVAGRRDPEPGRPRPPRGRRDGVLPAEGARERLVGGVARLDGDVEQGRVGGGHPVRRALEQDAGAEPGRRLARDRADHPLEVEAGQVRVGRHLVGPGRHRVEVGGQPVDEGHEVVGHPIAARPVPRPRAAPRPGRSAARPPTAAASHPRPRPCRAGAAGTRRGSGRRRHPSGTGARGRRRRGPGWRARRARRGRRTWPQPRPGGPRRSRRARERRPRPIRAGCRRRVGGASSARRTRRRPSLAPVQTPHGSPPGSPRRGGSGTVRADRGPRHEGLRVGDRHGSSLRPTGPGLLDRHCPSRFGK